MATVEKPLVEERTASPGAIPERISTNNPFRRGTGSPAPSPGLVSSSPSRRPPARNPFIDGSSGPTMEPASMEESVSTSPKRPTRPPGRERAPTETQGLLENMSLEDNRASQEGERRPMRNGHRPSNSQDGRPRPPYDPRRGPPPPRGGGPPRGPPRQRRNSDTSVSEQRKSGGEDGKPRSKGPMKDAQGRPIPSRDSRPKRPNRRLDLIDKLDLTGLYGEGSVHHDGPFDACNPYRNRKGSNRAPMQAFAKDSLNMSMGGSGPVRKHIDLDRVHGHQEDSFKDFSAPAVPQQQEGPTLQHRPYRGSQTQYEQYMPGARPRPGPRDGVDRTSRFDPTSKVEPVHGDESLGLGTSTFLEGTPAPQVAIQRRESEGESGLTRKKSLAQRIRGMSNNRPRGNSGSGMQSPEARYGPTSPALEGTSGGGLTRISERERNPFFQNHDEAYDKKSASIERAGSAPRRQVGSGELTRSAAVENGTMLPVVDRDQEAFTVAPPRSSSQSVGPTADAIEPAELKRAVTEGTRVPTLQQLPPQQPLMEEKKEGGGFLNRVKSLRGGKRMRPEKAKEGVSVRE